MRERKNLNRKSPAERDKRLRTLTDPYEKTIRRIINKVNEREKKTKTDRTVEEH